MDELQKLIVEEFGERILALVDPLERGIVLPLVDAVIPDAREIVRLMQKSQVIEFFHIMEQIVEIADAIGKGSSDVSLAARLFDHDSFPIYGSFQDKFHYLAGGETRREAEFLNWLCLTLANFRSFGITSAYLASGGNERFVSKIPQSQIEYLLEDMQKLQPGPRYKINFGNVSQGEIKSSEYIALCQLVKNARGDANIEIRENPNYRSLSVTDNGPGIVDKDNVPLPEERLHEIFGGYTSKKTGGGLGLQVVRRLAQLRGGYVNVTTKTKGNEPIGFSTKFGAIPPEHIQRETGTRFTIYVPK